MSEVTLHKVSRLWLESGDLKRLVSDQGPKILGNQSRYTGHTTGIALSLIAEAMITPDIPPLIPTGKDSAELVAKIKGLIRRLDLHYLSVEKGRNNQLVLQYDVLQEVAMIDGEFYYKK